MKKNIVLTCLLYVFCGVFAVNDIYFSTIAKGNFTFREPQKATIADIAYQCPLSGGVAVYRARALQYALTGGNTYDDFASCALQGLSWRHANPQVVKKNLSVSVVPNPTNGKTAFLFSYKTENTCTIDVFNSIGQKVKTYELPEKIDNYSFDTQLLANGIYYYHVSGLANSLNGKFIVEK